jgi:hypothetical protein
LAQLLKRSYKGFAKPIILWQQGPGPVSSAAVSLDVERLAAAEEQIQPSFWRVRASDCAQNSVTVRFALAPSSALEKLELTPLSLRFSALI